MNTCLTGLIFYNNALDFWTLYMYITQYEAMNYTATVLIIRIYNMYRFCGIQMYSEEVSGRWEVMLAWAMPVSSVH